MVFKLQEPFVPLWVPCQAGALDVDGFGWNVWKAEGDHLGSICSVGKGLGELWLHPKTALLWGAVAQGAAVQQRNLPALLLPP